MSGTLEVAPARSEVLPRLFDFHRESGWVAAARQSRKGGRLIDEHDTVHRVSGDRQSGHTREQRQASHLSPSPPAAQNGARRQQHERRRLRGRDGRYTAACAARQRRNHAVDLCFVVADVGFIEVETALQKCADERRAQRSPSVLNADAELS